MAAVAVSREMKLWKRQKSQILQKIDESAFYDAFHLTESAINRFSARLGVEEIITDCYDVAIKYADYSEFAYVTEMMNIIVTLFTRNGISPTDGIKVDMILELFNKLPQGEKMPAKPKYQVIDRAIEWTKNDLSPNGDERLHAAAARSYFDDGMYGKCQNHLVHCQDPHFLLKLTSEWQQHVYSSERSLIICRLVIILVYFDKLSLAATYLSLLPYDYNSISVPLPIQFGYLLVEAARSKSSPFFNTITTLYKPVLSDPFMAKLLKHIGQSFATEQNKPNNLLSMLSSAFEF